MEKSLINMRNRYFRQTLVAPLKIHICTPWNQLRSLKNNSKNLLLTFFSMQNHWLIHLLLPTHQFHNRFFLMVLAMTTKNSSPQSSSDKGVPFDSFHNLLQGNICRRRWLLHPAPSKEILHILLKILLMPSPEHICQIVSIQIRTLILMLLTI